MKISDLRAKRAKIVREMREMASGTGDLNPEQEQRFDAMKADLEGVDAKIERQTYLDEMERNAGAADTHKEFDGEKRQYSLIKAMAAQAGMNVDAGREKEVSQELAKRHGKQPQGFYAPLDVFHVERREWTGISTTLPAAGPGSNIVPVDYRPGMFIDLLRSKLVVNRLGARVLSGLAGNIDIPRLKASATAGWVAENSALSPSDMQFSKLEMTPKHAGCLTELTRNMLQQASPDVEQLVRMDFAALLARAVDSVAIVGGGANEPDGIFETAGINEVDVSGGWTWEAILTFIEKLESDDTSGSAFLTTPAMVKTFRSTPKATAVLITDGDPEAVSADYLMEGPSSLAGYPCAASTIAPADQLIFGNWSDLLIGYWSAFDLLVNPYASGVYEKGNVMVRGMLTMDCGVRHPESFCVADLIGG